MPLSPTGLRRLALALWVAAWFGGFLGIALELVLPLMLIVLPGWGTVGLLLARRRPDNAMGWVLLGVALLPAFGMALPIEGQTGSLGFGVAAMVVLFPTGTLPGRVWLVPLSFLVAAATLGGFVDLGSVALGEFGLPVWVLGAGTALVWCVAAPVVRLRRASIQERAQLRWLGFAAATAGVGLVSAGLGLVFGQGTLAGDLLLGVAALLVPGVLLLGFPGAILIAVLRYRLYEIDRVVSRSVTFTVVVGLVSAIYAVPAAVIPRLVGSSSSLVTAGATLAAAAAVAPLRRRVRRSVERRFNRSAFDALAEADAFAGAIRDEVAVGVIASRLADVVERTIQPRTIGLWLASGEPPGSR